METHYEVHSIDDEGQLWHIDADPCPDEATAIAKGWFWLGFNNAAKVRILFGKEHELHEIAELTSLISGSDLDRRLKRDGTYGALCEVCRAAIEWRSSGSVRASGNA